MTAERVVAAIDLGSSKVVAVLGRGVPGGGVEVLGKGECRSEGVDRAVVTSLEEAAACVAQAMRTAEEQAGWAAGAVYLAAGGEHVRSYTGRAALDLDGDRSGVSPDDVRDILKAAQAMVLPRNQRVLHVLPREFVLDGHSGIRDPVGMWCGRLEVVAHVVTAAVPHLENAKRAVRTAGYEVADVVVAPLATSYAVLEEDERREGVALVDMGAGTTDVAIFVNRQLAYASVVGLGGQDATSDIGVVLGMSRKEAERLKVESRIAKASLAPDDSVDVSELGTGSVKQYELREIASVVEARVDETLRLAAEEMAGFAGGRLLRGCVVTGGAADALGVVDVAASALGMRARLGKPHATMGPELASPSYACVTGLLLHALDERPELTEQSKKAGSWRSRMIQWFKESLA